MKKSKQDQAERLFYAFGDINPTLLESSRRYSPRTTGRGRGYRRTFLVAVAALLSLSLLTLTVFAAVPSLRRMLNLPFLSESERQDTVPEGWVGIYTVEDLDNIRNDLDGKYILMTDLTFADGDAPFTPIGTRREPFTGQLDGNGYVIRGLMIEAEQETPAIREGEHYIPGHGAVNGTYYDVKETLNVGLFGYCGGEYAVDTPYLGMISNLGIEGATVTVKNASGVSVGVMAGSGSYLAGCYVKDSTVSVSGYTREETDEAYVFVYAGGLVGTGDLVDSCYAENVDVSVADLASLDAAPYNCLLGGLAGEAYTIVTSYTESCELTADTDQVTKGDLWGHIHLLHRLMNESQFYTVYEKYYRACYGLSEEDPLPEDWKKTTGSASSRDDEAAFRCRKFASWYVAKDLGILVEYRMLDIENLNPAFLMGEFNPEMVMYLKDPFMTMEEQMALEAELVQRIGMERLCEIMTCDNRKIGPLDCYTLDPATSYKESDFAEFNFDTIWKMQDGRPVLRIFSN